MKLLSFFPSKKAGKILNSQKFWYLGEWDFFEWFSNTVQILDFDGVYTSFFSSRCGILETSRATLMLLGWPERESKYIWRNESSFFSAFFVDTEKNQLLDHYNQLLYFYYKHGVWK